MGMSPIIWDNCAFVNHWELADNTPILVEKANYYFNQLAHLVAATTQAFNYAFVQPTPQAPLALVGSYTSGDVGTSTIKVHMAIYIPAHYVGLFLGGSLTVAEAWIQLCVIIW